MSTPTENFKMNTETIYITGVLCNTCDNILRPHTMEQHLDKNHPIHQCPLHDKCECYYECECDTQPYQKKIVDST